MSKRYRRRNTKRLCFTSLGIFVVFDDSKHWYHRMCSWLCKICPHDLHYEISKHKFGGTKPAAHASLRDSHGARRSY
jgi:hypothetical protein